MDARFVGIDVSKDRLDVHVLPKGESFAVARNGEGLAALNERLAGLGVVTVAVEATGGFETVVAASLAGAGLPVVVVNPAQVRAFAQALGKRAKRIRLTRPSSPGSSRPPGRRFARCPMSKPRRWPIWSPDGARSSR